MEFPTRNRNLRASLQESDFFALIMVMVMVMVMGDGMYCFAHDFDITPILQGIYQRRENEIKHRHTLLFLCFFLSPCFMEEATVTPIHKEKLGGAIYKLEKIDIFLSIQTTS